MRQWFMVMTVIKWDSNTAPDNDSLQSQLAVCVSEFAGESSAILGVQASEVRRRLIGVADSPAGQYAAICVFYLVLPSNARSWISVQFSVAFSVRVEKFTSPRHGSRAASLNSCARAAHADYICATCVAAICFFHFTRSCHWYCRLRWIQWIAKKLGIMWLASAII